MGENCGNVEMWRWRARGREVSPRGLPSGSLYAHVQLSESDIISVRGRILFVNPGAGGPEAETESHAQYEEPEV